jgi:hypothetical protein
MIIIKKIEHLYYLFEIKDNVTNKIGIITFLYGFELDKEYDINWKKFFRENHTMTLYHYDDKNNRTEEHIIKYVPKIMTAKLKEAMEKEQIE